MVLATKVASLFPPADILAISMSYGQRHSQKELHAAQWISADLGIDFESIILPEIIFRRSTSTLIDPSQKMPQMTYQEIQETQGVSPTYVPFRNGIFLSIATAIALTRGIENVYIATHAEDSQNWAYPDCTPEFNGSMASAIYIGTYMRTRVLTPFQWMMKSDIVRLGLELSAPFHLSWSCYEGREKACGKCPTCVERLEAFRLNNAIDPITYEEGN